MTTKTDFHAIMELKKRYTPTQRGIVNDSEEELITATLELKSRTNIELQNVRDMVVMLYSQFANREGNDVRKTMELMDAMSVICGVIDQNKLERGMAV